MIDILIFHSASRNSAWHDFVDKVKSVAESHNLLDDV